MSQLLDCLTAEAINYRVTRAEHGFAVWMFRDWNERNGGWDRIANNLKTREAGWSYVSHKLHLTEEEPPKAEPIRAVVTWSSFGDPSEWG